MEKPVMLSEALRLLLHRDHSLDPSDLAAPYLLNSMSHQRALL